MNELIGITVIPDDQVSSLPAEQNASEQVSVPYAIEVFKADPLITDASIIVNF